MESLKEWYPEIEEELEIDEQKKGLVSPVMKINSQWMRMTKKSDNELGEENELRPRSPSRGSQDTLSERPFRFPRVFRSQRSTKGIKSFRRCTWCNGYRRRNWTQRHEFKSSTDCITQSTNTLGKGMNPIILPPAMGK